MKFELTFGLIFLSVVNSQNVDDFQLFSQCDRTVGSGVATCMQYFSPIKFVTDFLKSDKESLCWQNACINGVRDAVRVAKVANLCPDSFADELISTVTDSTVNNYIRNLCKTFNTGKCVMESVGDVLDTIQGFFIPQQQQKPVVPQLIQTIPRLFDRNGDTNSYSVDENYRNHNYGPNGQNGGQNVGYNNREPSIFNSFREMINPRRVVTKTTTANPLINHSIRDLYDRQYIPEASDVSPVKEVSDEDESEVSDPLRSLFTGLFGSPKDTKQSNNTSEETNIFEAIGGIIGSGLNHTLNNRNQTNGQNFFSDIFSFNDTEGLIVKDFGDSIN